MTLSPEGVINGAGAVIALTAALSVLLGSQPHSKIITTNGSSSFSR